MGLDTSHGCWHGSYTAFNHWREKLAQVAGLPPLRLMEGFYEPLNRNSKTTLYSTTPTLYHGAETNSGNWLTRIDTELPIKWNCLKPSPLHRLLYHSDCDGKIAGRYCLPIAKELKKLIPLLPDEDASGHIGNWRAKTQAFVDGLKLAHSQKEAVRFH